jgi:hypothetical protein
VQRILAAAPRRALFSVVVAVVALLVGAPRAFAGDAAVEKEAQGLEKKAIEEDFLNVDYPAAIKKLQSAIAKCGDARCDAKIKGALLRDLGAMQILAGNEGEGRASFARALGADGALELDPAYKNPQLEGVWSDVKKKAGAGGGGGGAEPAAGGPQPTGDFAHTPAPEAPVRTPLPIYAEYSGSETLARVIVKYKGQGMADWKPLELTKMGTGFGGQVPCKDVPQGTMSYYIQGFNAANDPVATSGSRNKPYTVGVKAQITGPAPALPGQEPPKQCSELAGAECPPDFPGCNNKKASGEDCDKDLQCASGSCVGGKCADKKAGGEECAKDDDCASGTCSDGKCTAAKKSGGEDCESNEECDSGSCKEGKCSSGGGPFQRVWVGVAVSLDWYVMPAANNVCLATQGLINSAGYSCADPNDGSAFPPNSEVNGDIVVGRSDQVQGGFAHGPLTLMLSMDYALNANMLAGVRGGYEIFTSPLSNKAFAPVHGEARFTYLFGRDAITKKVAPMAFVGAGVGEFDAFVPVTVILNPSANVKPNNPYNYNAWLSAGPFFASGGGGVRIGIGRRAAATIAVKVLGAFGGQAGSLIGFAPELGIQYGF